MSDPFIAEIRAVGFNYPPVDWASCHGQLLQISQFSAVYALVGTYYGGDGRTTLGVPDLQGRVALGYGNGSGLSPRRIGEKSGYEHVSLSVAQLPAHSHAMSGAKTAPQAVATQIPAVDADANNDSPSSTLALARVNSSGRACPAYSDAAVDSAITGPTVEIPELDVAGGVADTGNGQGHINMQPYLAINYIFALQGLFPERQ